MKTFFFISLMTLFCLNTPAQNWVQSGNDLTGKVMGDYFGQSASISADGNTVAVGAPNNGDAGNKAGQVRVFTYAGTTWSQKGGDINGEAGGEQSGAVGINADGNTVIVGGYGSGHYSSLVRIFDFDGANWVQRGTTISSESNAFTGTDVDISANGDRIIFSNTGYNENTGQVLAFEWNGSSWAQLGSDINGTEQGDGFGISLSVSADGNTFVAGAPRSSPIESKSGEVKVYEFNGAEWVLKGDAILGEQAIGLLGSDVGISADGNTIIAGEDGFKIGGYLVGRTRIFTWNGAHWVQKGTDIEGVGNNDRIGRSVAINSTGNIVATQGLGGDGSEKGNARMFQFNGTDWVQLGQTLIGSLNSSDLLGSGMDFSDTGDKICIGSPRWNTNTGMMQVFQFDGSTGIYKNNMGIVALHPNPTNGNFTIDLGKEYSDITVQIYNPLGEIISSEKYAFTRIIENQINNSQGIYLVKVTTASGESVTLRIMMQ